MMPYFELTDHKRFVQQAAKYFCGKYPQIKKKQVAAAAEAAFQELDNYYAEIRLEAVSYTHLSSSAPRPSR